MSILGQAVIQIDGDTTPLNKSIKGVDGSLRKAVLGSAVGNVIADGVGFIASKVASVGSAVVNSVVGNGLDRALNLQDARKQLEGLGHDAENIDTIMGNALESVKGTAFGLGDAATVAASAVGAGIEPGKELERTLKLTANSAALAKTGIDEMGSILNKVWTSGRVGTEELNSLADRGIPIWQSLAEEYGVTQDELRKMVSAGKVDAETFANVLEGTVGNAAGAMGETARGSFDNIGAALGRLGAMFLTPGVEGAPGLFQSISGAVDSLGEVLAPVATQFGEWLAPAMEDVAKWIDEIDFGELISGMGSGEGALSDFMAALSPLGQVFKAMLPGILELGAVFKQLGTTLGSALVTLLPVVGDLLMTILDVVTPLIPLVGDILVTAFNALLPPLMELASQLLPVVATLISTLLQAISPLIPVVLSVVEAFLPLLPVIGQLISALIPPLMSLLNALMPVITILVDVLVAVLVPAFEVVGTIITWLVDNILVPLISFITDNLTAVIALFSGDWDTYWNRMKEVFTVVWEAIKEFALAAITWVRDQIQDRIDLIKALWSAAWDFVKNKIMDRFNAIKALVKAAVNYVKDQIQSRVDLIKSLWSTAWNSVKTKVTDIFNSIKNTVSTKISDVVETVKGLPQRAIDALGNLKTKLVDAGKDLIQGFKDGIEDMFDSVKDTLGDLTDSLTSWKGPEALDKVLLTNNGELLIGGFIKGLEGKYGDVKKSLQGFTSGLSAEVNPSMAFSGGIGGQGRNGGMTTGPIHVEINVNGSDPEAGKQAGEAAGDALLKKLGYAVQAR